MLRTLPLPLSFALVAGCASATQAPMSPTDSVAEPAPAADGEARATGADGLGDDASAQAPGGLFPAREAATEKAPSNRPGLATTFGEQRESRVTSAPFRRAEKTTPFSLAKLFYNDPDGIAAMSDSNPGARQDTRRFAVGTGHVEIGLRDGGGNFLTGFRLGGENYVTGIAGRRYTIVVKNHSPGRVEAVVSVDGLDVIDGSGAALTKRGYLIDPYGDLEIEGFRTSPTEVAAFRFGSVDHSYASRKHGDARNVGVIGIALFHEQGDSPRAWGSPRSHEDVVQRHDAQPFPSSREATP